jgi:hypothetical protein
VQRADTLLVRRKPRCRRPAASGCASGRGRRTTARRSHTPGSSGAGSRRQLRAERSRRRSRSETAAARDSVIVDRTHRFGEWMHRSATDALYHRWGPGWEAGKIAQVPCQELSMRVTDYGPSSYARSTLPRSSNVRRCASVAMIRESCRSRVRAGTDAPQGTPLRGGAIFLGERRFRHGRRGKRCNRQRPRSHGRRRLPPIALRAAVDARERPGVCHQSGMKA